MIDGLSKAHLKRFMEWLKSPHFEQKYMGCSPEGVLLYQGEKPDDIIAAYMEWSIMTAPALVKGDDSKCPLCGGVHVDVTTVWSCYDCETCSSRELPHSKEVCSQNPSPRCG